MKTRGSVAIVVLWALGALGATQFVPNWRIDHLFAAKLPTKELDQARAELEKAKAEAELAQRELLAAKAAEVQRTLEQARYAQQMVAGIPPALARAPQGPAVQLATSLALRAHSGLAAAIGDLPPEKQDEIVRLVAAALSDIATERDAAQQALARKDAELAAATAAKHVLEQQIPALQDSVKTKDGALQQKTEKVSTLTTQVERVAEKLAEKEERNGSLGALVEKLGWLIGFLFIAYMAAHFVLPCLAQEFPGVAWLGAVNRTVKSLASAHE